MIYSSGDPINFIEINAALDKLSWHKSPGINNRVSLNMIKALNKENYRVLFLFIHNWMDNENLTYKVWMESRLVLSLKKGDLQDLNNWRGINLLDVVSKLISIILNI